MHTKAKFFIIICIKKILTICLVIGLFESVLLTITIILRINRQPDRQTSQIKARTNQQPRRLKQTIQSESAQNESLFCFNKIKWPLKSFTRTKNLFLTFPTHIFVRTFPFTYFTYSYLIYTHNLLRTSIRNRKD